MEKGFRFIPEKDITGWELVKVVKLIELTVSEELYKRMTQDVKRHFKLIEKWNTR